LLLLLVLREVKDREPEGLPSSFTVFHTLEKAPLMRRRALALRPLPSSALLQVHYLSHLGLRPGKPEWTTPSARIDSPIS